MTDQEGGGEKPVQFVCKDCGKKVEREMYRMDTIGVQPSRCVSCVFDRMAEP